MAKNIVFKVSADTSGVKTGMEQATQATNQATKSVSQLDSSLAKLGAMVAGAFALDRLMAFGKAVYEVNNQVKSLEIRMLQLQGTADQTDRAFGMLIQLSKQLGVNMIDLTQNYTQFVSTAKASGIEVQKAEKIFTNMSIALKGTGASADATKRAMTALIQMMGKGTIMSEELKGQLGEAMPQAIGWMAESLGVGTKELFKMMEQGKLTSDALLGFSQVAVDKVGGAVQQMSTTIEANVARLSNSWESYMANFGARFYGSGGGAEVLSDMLDWWLEINQTQEQFIQSERRRLLGNLDAQQRVEAELKGLRDKKSSQEEILTYLKTERDLNVELAKTGKNRFGVQQDLSNQLKIEILKTAQAYDAEIKVINEDSQARKKNESLTADQIKAIEKERIARLKLRQEMDKAIKDIYKVDTKELFGDDKIFNEGQKAKREARDRDTKEAESTAKILRDLELSQQEREIQDFKDKEQKKTEIAKSQQEQRKENEVALYSGLASTAEAWGQRELEVRKQTLDKQREQGIVSEEAYLEQLKVIKRKQFLLDKLGAVAQIAISTAINVAQASNPLMAPLIPGIIASGAIQAGLVLAQPVPYNKGTKRVPMLRGAVRGQDSVHAILTPGERVVPEDINGSPGYSKLLDLAQDRKISDKEAGFLADIAVSGMRPQQTAEIDPDAIGQSIAKYIPHSTFAINERGIAVITERSHNETRRLKTRL